MNTQDKKTQETLHMAYIIEAMEVANRWSFNPFKHEIICFWDKYMDDECVIYKAKEWVQNVTLGEFLHALVHNFKRYRMFWFNDTWPCEITGSNQEL